MDFKNALKATAATLGLGKLVEASPMVQAARTKKREEEAAARGRRRKGKPYGSIIAYERKGPFYRQEGTTATTLPSGAVVHKPRLVQYFKHRFLHATKGWRTATHIPAAMRRA